MKLIQCDVCKEIKPDGHWPKENADTDEDICVECDLIIGTRVEQRYADLEAKFSNTVMIQTAVMALLTALHTESKEKYKRQFGTAGLLMLEQAIGVKSPDDIVKLICPGCKTESSTEDGVQVGEDCKICGTALEVTDG